MKKLSSIILTAFLFFSCTKNNNDAPPLSGETDLSVYLTDDPGEYDQVNLDIQGMEVHYTDDTDDKWYTLKNFHNGVYDILRFTNGKDTLLANDRVSAKHINQIRLILGDNNTVVVDGTTYPLETPSGQESGVKLNVDATLTEGIKYEIWTDFDAQKSIVVTGNNKYILKPVVRVYTKAITGSISGVVLPVASKAWVYAVSGDDTIASTRPDAVSGAFLINGLNAGQYRVLIDGNNGFEDAKREGVEVTTGNVTDVGTTMLHK
jgi:hypothetical protein